MLILNEDEVADYLSNSHSAVIERMEEAFKDYNNGVAKMIPKTYLTHDTGDYRAMPAQWYGFAGVKWISVYPHNKKHFNLPTIYGTLILNDLLTGAPLAIMDCATLTAYRTAAVSAVAAKHIKDPEQQQNLAFIGCGYQARLHAEMYMEAFPKIGHIDVYDTDEKNARQFFNWLQKNCIGTSWDIKSSIEGACNEADIVTTLTPSTSPYLKLDHVKSTCHINAVGADAEGKRELHDDILKASTIIVDDYEQASHSGELQYNKDLPYRTLGDIITEPFAKKAEGVTIFDSTGVAIEDIAIGALIYERYYNRN
ncbi:ornithine cyclodeaminase family protein [bacterium]|nr:ornithine cyclodeaminase family protein [bacterium]